MTFEIPLGGQEAAKQFISEFNWNCLDMSPSSGAYGATMGRAQNRYECYDFYQRGWTHAGTLLALPGEIAHKLLCMRDRRDAFLNLVAYLVWATRRSPNHHVRNDSKAKSGLQQRPKHHPTTTPTRHPLGNALTPPAKQSQGDNRIIPRRPQGVET